MGMDIGLNIAPKVRVRIGDKLEAVEESLTENEIEYDTASGRESDTGSKDMIIFMREYGVELNLIDNIITFIKSNNTEANYIMDLEDDTTPITALMTIKKKLAESFNIEPSSIRIDRFDGRSLNSSLSIPVSKRDKVKLELVMGAKQKVYLRSIELLYQ